ncbi:MAG: family transcriptional regulator [Clostridia bacterium]|jgi:predicted NBD/HSP70 family sugar kinase|nr:family transcriptional regulator [Clostridia bacterium]
MNTLFDTIREKTFGMEVKKVSNNKKHGVNMGDVKIANRKAILELLHKAGKMSRKDIADELGLTQGAVSLICNEMLERQIIKYTGERTGDFQVGRKKVLMEINYRFKYVIGIDISVKQTTLTIGDLSGQVISKQKLDTDTTIAANEFLKNVSVRVIKFMWENNIFKDEILAIGVSILGAVNHEAGISLKALDIWEGPVDIKQILENEIQLPVYVESNVCAFAIAEKLYGNMNEVSSALFLKWGPGVGSVSVLNGNIYKSHDWLAAEIGHNILEKDGTLCRCGQKGCLETVVSTKRIRQSLTELIDSKTTPYLHDLLQQYDEEVTRENTIACLLSEDKSIAEYSSYLIESLAYVTYNATKNVLPEKIILCGYLFENSVLREKFVEKFNQFMGASHQMIFEKSSLTKKEDYIGSIALATKDFFSANIV